ncbi:polysaccharide deacetylase family protein [Paenibacillus sp. FSL W7-1287]|uniref:polysaccharide deacetylase family protein n=1 Tax=Paenibacillus sp. FSL W7-1287 TaxID=2954538 RepID=UPI0030FB7544
MENLLTWGFYFMTFYAFIPGLLSRVFGYRVFKKGDARNELALTFDDGPDPIYTEQLLNLLKKYNAKGTFFVVGVHAEQYPELLLRMKEEGHTIGVHNYEHKTNWFMRPKTVKKHIELTNDIIEKVTGERSIYYRPPWGIMNLFDYRNVSKLHIVLWSSLFGDWSEKITADKLKKRMLKKVAPGEVLLLHDCGRTLGADVDAPRNMLIALEAYLKAATEKGLKMVTIDELIALSEGKLKQKRSLGKRMLIKLWLGWETLFHKVMKLKAVKVEDGSMLHYRLITYKGEEISMHQDDVLSNGDLIAELHFDNRKLSEIAFTSKNPLVVAVKTIREVERALPKLATMLAAEQQAKHIKAIQGITMINRGADKLGFSIHSMPEGLFKKSTEMYLSVLMKVLTPKQNSVQSNAAARKATVEEPKILIMSTNYLYENFAQH